MSLSKVVGYLLDYVVVCITLSGYIGIDFIQVRAYASTAVNVCAVSFLISVRYVFLVDFD